MDRPKAIKVSVSVSEIERMIRLQRQYSLNRAAQSGVDHRGALHRPAVLKGGT